jgi:hypothetical protein
MNALTIIGAPIECNQLIESCEEFDHDRSWTAKAALVALERDLPARHEVARALAVLEHALATPAPMETLIDIVDDMIQTQCVAAAVTPQYRAFLASRLGKYPEAVVRLAVEDVLTTLDGGGRPIAVAAVLGAADRHGRRLREQRRTLSKIDWSIKRLQVIAGGGEDPDDVPF